MAAIVKLLIYFVSKTEVYIRKYIYLHLLLVSESP